MSFASFTRRRLVLAIAAACVLLTVIALVSAERVRWRAQVLMMRASGQITDIDWSDLLDMLMPSSPQSLAGLLDTRNPYTVIRNPRSSAIDLAKGNEVFGQHCVACHGSEGQGSIGGPVLKGRSLSHGDSDWAVYRTLRYGVPKTAMPAHALDQAQLWQLVTYVRSLTAGPAPLRSTVGAAPDALKTVRLPYAELRSTREPAEDWLTYSGSYSSIRHSALTDVNRASVARLVPRWIHQFGGFAEMRVETSPIVRGGIMFATAPSGGVLALNAASGAKLWEFNRSPPQDSIGFPGIINRGAALLDDKVFVGTGDAHLLALSAQTGKLLWDTPVVDYKKERHCITGAPLAFGNLVVIGTAVFGSRGFVTAYDANTGAERWRFSTIPLTGEPGNDTWAGDSWQKGGGSTWMTGSYDPDTDTLYWGVGNPLPDYNSAVRKGDNLYTNSVVALRGATGKLLWYFQFTPNDDHDWDAAQVPVLADYAGGPGATKRLLWPNRNGFYYVLDRDSGQYISATAFVEQNWAQGIDSRGRPILRNEGARNPKGVLVNPSNVGATNWWSPSWDPRLNLMFVPTLERSQIFFAGDNAKNHPASSGLPHYTAVRALDASTGKLAWEYRREPRFDDEEMGGLLSTRGGILFGGDQATFFALDSQSGKLLWSFPTGGLIAAAPITYVAGGEQYVLIAAGSALLSFALAPAAEPVVKAEAKPQAAK